MEQTNDPISDESSMSLDEIRIKLCESEKILNMLKDSSLKDSLSLVQDLLMRNETIMKSWLHASYFLIVHLICFLLFLFFSI